MPFIAANFDLGPMAAKGAPKVARYTNTAETLAQIGAAAYFDSTIAGELLSVGDAIWIVGSDGATWRRVSAKTNPSDITLAAISA